MQVSPLQFLARIGMLQCFSSHLHDKKEYEVKAKLGKIDMYISIATNKSNEMKLCEINEGL